MLKHELRQGDEIPVLHPEGPLEAADFTTLARELDACGNPQMRPAA